MQLKVTLFKLLFVFLLIHQLTAQPAGQAAYLSVVAEDSLQIYLNGDLISHGSFDSLALLPGSYRIHAYDMHNLSWENRGISKEIILHDAESITFRLSEARIIRLASDPPASKVFYNDEFLGNTPLIFFHFATDDEKAEITVLKAGYHIQKFSLSDRLGEYNVILTPEKEIRTNYVHKAGIESEGFRWSREGLVITSLATSWLSFFLKREADKNYDKYLRSSDPGRMETYYKRTQNLDTYAEISVGISALSLGTYFYFLLTE